MQSNTPDLKETREGEVNRRVKKVLRMEGGIDRGSREGNNSPGPRPE